MSRFAAATILDQLDACAREFDFPMLDNANMVFFFERLHVMRSATEWGIVFELGGSNPLAGALEATGTHLYRFGSCLRGPPGSGNGDADWSLFSEGAGPAYCADELDEFVDPRATTIRIRGKEVPISSDQAWYATARITLLDPERPRFVELFRALAALHGDLFPAPDSVLYERFEAVPPVILRLDAWNHPDLAGDVLPSGCETFRQIADVIESGDVGRYAPTLPASTHWSHWPESGGNTAWGDSVARMCKVYR